MASEQWLSNARGTLDHIERTQLGAVRKAADLMAEAIAKGRVVHTFGSGHAHMPVEELYPRIGGIVGFHPVTYIGLTYFTNILGDGGVFTLSWLERIEGFAAQILKSHDLRPGDVMLLFSHSGVNGVVIDMAIEAKKRDMPVVAVTSAKESAKKPTRHSSGKRLYEHADLVIDTGLAAEDAVVKIDGLEDRVGPGSSLAFITVANLISCEVAKGLVKRGVKPFVNVSYNQPEQFASAEQHMDRALAEYRKRVLMRP